MACKYVQEPSAVLSGEMADGMLSTQRQARHPAGNASTHVYVMFFVCVIDMLFCVILCCSAAEPGAWYACLPLEVVYHYDPIPQAGPEALAAAAQLEQDASQDEEFDEDDLSPAAAAAAGGGGGGATAADAHMSPCTSLSFDEVAASSECLPLQGTAAAGGDGGCNGSGDLAMVDADSAAVAAAGCAPARQLHQQQSQGTTLQKLCSPELTPPPPAAAATAGLPAAAAAAAGTASQAAAAATFSAARRGSSGGSSGGDTAHKSSSSTSVLNEDEMQRVLGSQANLWTEYVPDEETAEYMLLPRLAALSEAVW
jgi:hypothetical protein